jgi:heavy metal sensor kinase
LISIRTRIAISYVATAALLGLSCELGVYALAKHRLAEQVDAVVSACLDGAAQSVQHEISEYGDKSAGEAEFHHNLDMVLAKSFPQEAISVFEGDRVVADRNGGTGLETGDRPRPAPGKAVSMIAAGIPLRMAAREVALPQFGAVYLLVVAEPLAPMEKTLQSLRWTLALMALSGILFSAVGGYLLTRASLRPVVAMARAVEQLNAENLSDHLPELDSKDELGMLAATFNRLLRRLNDSFERQRQFMAEASHELKTPISIANVTAQVTLARERHGSEYRQAIADMQQQIERLSRMVQDMLLLARSDDAVFTVHRERCDFAEITADAVHAARHLARARGVWIDLDAAFDAPVEGDPGLLQQLVLILLDNAVKYSEEGTRIRCTLVWRNPYYDLRVSDEGCGIPADAQPRIFDRFFRLEQERRQSIGGGAGLGLPIARRIAALHGGTVDLIMSGPEGSTFEVRLPGLAPPVAVEDGVMAGGGQA